MNLAPNLPPRGLFVTGTDTDVGKTYVSAMIAAALKAQGHRVGVYKPVASGCIVDGDQLVSEDAVRLWESAGRPLSLELVCPQLFEAPIAPHLAAKREGKTLSADLARRGLEAWTGHCDIVIVEGAGGLMSPLDEEEYIADLAFDFGYPMVVVAANVVGAINQTLQTLITADCFRDGIDVAGVVLNDVRAEDAAAESNEAEISSRAVRPVLSRVRHGADCFDSEVDWWKLSSEVE